MSAKSDILATLRSAIAQSQPAAAEDRVIREYRVEGLEPAGAPDVLDEFVSALEDYHAEVAVVTAEEVPTAIETMLASVDAHSVVVPAGLEASWITAARGDGLPVEGREKAHTNGSVGPRDVLVDSREEPVDKDVLAQSDAVVTAARAAVSASGTIVLDGEPDQGRRVITLLPDTHVCVVAASQVFPTVPEAVAVIGQHPQRPLTWIAGPSATSDIELVRVDGVHGPRKLRVVVVRGV